MKGFEQLLVKLDDGPWTACSRALLGFLIVPAASQLIGETARTAWGLAGFFLGALFLVRLVPAVARAVVPFSQASLNVWGYRRGLGKRYDSYQWQKLLWVGLGMFGQILVAREFPRAAVTLSMLCIGTGLVGLIAWRTVDVRIRNRFDARPDAQRNVAVVANQPIAP